MYFVYNNDDVFFFNFLFFLNKKHNFNLLYMIIYKKSTKGCSISIKEWTKKKNYGQKNEGIYIKENLIMKICNYDELWI